MFTPPKPTLAIDDGPSGDEPIGEDVTDRRPPDAGNNSGERKGPLVERLPDPAARPKQGHVLFRVVASQTGAASSQVLGAAGAMATNADTLRREVDQFIAKVRAA